MTLPGRTDARVRSSPERLTGTPATSAARAPAAAPAPHAAHRARQHPRDRSQPRAPIRSRRCPPSEPLPAFEPLPLDAIAADALTRDRAAIDPTALEELKASILAPGLRMPIEVFELADPDGPRRYGLISGFRRLAAVRALADDRPRRLRRHPRLRPRPRPDRRGDDRDGRGKRHPRRSLPLGAGRSSPSPPATAASSPPSRPPSTPSTPASPATSATACAPSPTSPRSSTAT